jgi:hypothetical protein
MGKSGSYSELLPPGVASFAASGAEGNFAADDANDAAFSVPWIVAGFK